MKFKCWFIDMPCFSSHFAYMYTVAHNNRHSLVSRKETFREVNWLTLHTERGWLWLRCCSLLSCCYTLKLMPIIISSRSVQQGASSINCISIDTFCLSVTRDTGPIIGPVYTYTWSSTDCCADERLLLTSHHINWWTRCSIYCQCHTCYLSWNVQQI